MAERYKQALDNLRAFGHTMQRSLDFILKTMGSPLTDFKQVRNTLDFYLVNDYSYSGQKRVGTGPKGTKWGQVDKLEGCCSKLGERRWQLDWGLHLKLL